MTRPFEMSRHAVQRALDMALEADEIRDAVLRPRSSFWSPRTRTDWRTRGRVTACVGTTEYGQEIVTTVLWAKPSGWRADEEFGSYDGRDQFEVANARRVVRARRKAR